MITSVESKPHAVLEKKDLFAQKGPVFMGTSSPHSHTWPSSRLLAAFGVCPPPKLVINRAADSQLLEFPVQKAQLELSKEAACTGSEIIME